MFKREKGGIHPSHLPPPPPERLKVVLFGVSGVGKSSICTRFIHNTLDYLPPASSDDCYERRELVDGYMVIIELLEARGAEEFVALRDLYIKSATHFYMVYSITSKDSYNHLKDYWKPIEECHSKPIGIVVGNKLDLEETAREVTEAEGRSLADSLGCYFMEVSALKNINILESVMELVSYYKPMPAYTGRTFSFHSTMSEDFEALFNSSLLSDLTILVLPEKRQIHLHKLVIHARYPSFLEFFKEGVFHCSDIEYDHLLAITKWIYVGLLSFPTPSLLEPAIIALKIYPLLPPNSSISNTITKTIQSPHQTAANSSTFLNSTSPKGATLSVPRSRSRSPTVRKTTRSPSPLTTYSFQLSLERIFNDPSTSDITIAVGNKSFIAHELILVSRSPYFKSLLTNGFKESYSPHPKIIIQDTSPDVFFELLKYFYFDDLTVTRLNWQELLDCALKYGVMEIINLVGHYIIDLIDPDNVIDVYSIYKEYGHYMQPLLDKIKYVAAYYHTKICASKSWKEADEETKAIFKEWEVRGNWAYPEEKKDKESCMLQ